MTAGSSGPAVAGNRVWVEDSAWRRLVRRPEAVVARALRGAGGSASVVLAGDRAVRRLNANHRGQDRATNVLTFGPAAAGLAGEIILALGTVRKEAAAAGRRPAHHLAHLVVHGCLHLDGHDHHHAGDARRMEMREARILAGIGVPNPWRSR